SSSSLAGETWGAPAGVMRAGRGILTSGHRGAGPPPGRHPVLRHRRTPVLRHRRTLVSGLGTRAAGPEQPHPALLAHAPGLLAGRIAGAPEKIRAQRPEDRAARVLRHDQA